MANEVCTLEQINHGNIIKVKESWLENAGSQDAKMITILEAGETDLIHYGIKSLEDLKSITRGSPQ